MSTTFWHNGVPAPGIETEISAPKASLGGLPTQSVFTVEPVTELAAAVTASCVITYALIAPPPWATQATTTTTATGALTTAIRCAAAVTASASTLFQSVALRAAETVAVRAWLDTEPMAASLTCSAIAVAPLVTEIALEAVALIPVVASYGITEVTVTATVLATLTTEIPLTASVSVPCTALLSEVVLAAAVVSVVSALASLATGIALDGQASVTAAASVYPDDALVGIEVCAATVSADLSTEIALAAATSASAAGVASTLSTSIRLAAVALCEAILEAPLRTGYVTLVTGSLYNAEGVSVKAGNLRFNPIQILQLDDRSLGPQRVVYSIPPSGHLAVPIVPSGTVPYRVDYDPTPGDLSVPVKLKPGYWVTTWYIPDVPTIDVGYLSDVTPPYEGPVIVVPYAAAVTARATVSAAFSTAIRMAATVTAATSVGAAFSTSIPLASAVAAAATVTGAAFSTAIRMAGAVASAATVAAALDVASLPPTAYYWAFNEGTSTSIADTGDAAHAATATLTSGTWVTGKFSGGINNASSSHAATLASAINIGPIHTVACWIKNWDGSNDGVVIGGPFGHYAFYLDATDVYYNGAGSFVSAAHGGGLSDGSWHHLAVVRSNNNTQFYKDGAAIGSLQSGSGTSDLQLRAFLAYYDGTFPFIASLDDLRIYTVALTAPEIAQLYALTP